MRAGGSGAGTAAPAPGGGVRGRRNSTATACRNVRRGRAEVGRRVIERPPAPSRAPSFAPAAMPGALSPRRHRAPRIGPRRGIAVSRARLRHDRRHRAPRIGPRRGLTVSGSCAPAPIRPGSAIPRHPSDTRHNARCPDGGSGSGPTRCSGRACCRRAPRPRRESPRRP